MYTIELKSGRQMWVDNLTHEKGKYFFTYVRKDGTIEKHETDETAVVDVVETSGTVKDYFEKKNVE